MQWLIVDDVSVVRRGELIEKAWALIAPLPPQPGSVLDERIGKVHFWTMFVGFHTTFLVHHWLGNRGMPRRYADYLPQDGFTTLHTISTIGSFVLGASTLFFIYNIWKSWRFGAAVTVDDPWGYGNSLEWATTCPPPLRNFDRIPRIRSERPAFDAKYGTLVADLGRDLPQRAAKPPQTLRDQLHRERHMPESPGAEGAPGTDGATTYQPDPQSGARPVEVPDPGETRRPSFERTREADENPLDSQRSEQAPPQWRHPGDEDDERR